MWIQDKKRAFTQVDIDITDTTHDPNYIVTEIQQLQKDFTDDEIRQITQRYSEGASVYELARDVRGDFIYSYDYLSDINALYSWTSQHVHGSLTMRFSRQQKTAS